MRLFAFHLLNDFSGSPKVLSQLIRGWDKNGLDVTVCSSFDNDGFLSDLPPRVARIPLWYRFYEHKALRLFALMISQLWVILRLFFVVRRNDILYVNTVLPFGASLLGRLKGCRVVVHVHETTMKPPILKRFLFGIVRHTADEVIYVSHFLAAQEPMPGVRTHVLHNALPDAFFDRAATIPRDMSMPRNVLMVCSLKVYKGVNEFVALARRLPQYRFRMVVNAPMSDIDSFFQGQSLPDNLDLYPTQRDVLPHYAWADLIVNLSHPDSWVETFGLTIIEGMAFGLPAIVPPVGGITEVVEHDVNGYQVDPTRIDSLVDAVNATFESTATYARLSANATRKLDAFREQAFIVSSIHILDKLS